MKSKTSNVVTPYQFEPIKNWRMYWATHFYSALLCMHSHKQFEYGPRRLAGFPDWRLSDLRGCLPTNFFHFMKNYMHNWGAQYFFASFLNKKVEGGIIKELVRRLEEIHNATFSQNLDEFNVFVSGADSALSEQLKDISFTIFPLELNGLKPVAGELIARSDLCLVLSSNTTEERVGIFGEVEANYGSKLWREAFWAGKQDFCAFGVGVIDGSQKQVYFSNYTKGGYYRVLIQFERNHFIVSDFERTLDFFEFALHNGPLAAYPQVADEEFNYLANFIKMSWNVPAIELMAALYSHADDINIAGINQGAIILTTSVDAS